MAKKKLKNRAELFYVGFRCSLLHHGDLASFCGINALPPDASGNPTLLKIFPDAGWSLCGSYSYDLHALHPYVLKDRLVTIFQKYCNDLRANSSSPLAVTFKRKLEHDYGVMV